MNLSRLDKTSYPRPLLDRLLVDESGRGVGPALDGGEYAAIIRRDVELLLNSRSRLRLGEELPDGEEWSVTEYGLPDFSHLDPQSAADRAAIADAVAEALGHFEPRLSNVAAEAVAFGAGAYSIRIEISATLAASGEPFDCATAIQL